MAKTKVILTTDIAGQGRKGDIISVSDGYAQNFLFKNNKAILASPEALAKIEKDKKKEEKKQLEEKENAIKLKEILEQKEISIAVKTGDNGKLFGAITNKEVSLSIKENFNLDIDRKKIEANIKSLGLHTVIVKLHSSVKADLKVNVIEKNK